MMRRGISLLMLINTGARPSEIAGLKVKHVALGEGTEAISILPDGRTLKNRNSARTIPLAGVSLRASRLAMQAAQERGAEPDDWLFPRYAVGGILSAAMNRFLRAHNLLPESAVAYGLRHGFEDRMIDPVSPTVCVPICLVTLSSWNGTATAAATQCRGGRCRRSHCERSSMRPVGAATPGASPRLARSRRICRCSRSGSGAAGAGSVGRRRRSPWS